MSTEVVEIEDFAALPSRAGYYPKVNQLVTSPDGRIFVTDQEGYIYLVGEDGKAVNEYLSVSRAIYSAGLDSLMSPFWNSELGLQSIAFHPDFTKVGSAGYGRLYVVASVGSQNPEIVRGADFTPGGGEHIHDNVLLEFRAATPEAGTFVPAKPQEPFRELLRVEGPYANHPMGLAAFNPNAIAGSPDYGKLYVGLGDGGGGGDPLKLAQNRSKPYGKILRIDPLGTNGANGRYGIPTDNPFIGVEGSLPEIWALGFRNPQRFAWDRGGDGRMFIADIGERSVEEIDVGVPGANYGWGIREGSFVYVNVEPLDPAAVVGENARSDSSITGFTYPIAEYDHDEGISITMGGVARGNVPPALKGKLIFGDIATGRVFALDPESWGGGPDAIRSLRLSINGVEKSFFQQIIGTPGLSHLTRADLRFGSDNTGRMFLLNKWDGIIRVFTSSYVPATPTPTPEMRLPHPPIVTGKKVIKSSVNRFQLRGRVEKGCHAEFLVEGKKSYRKITGGANWKLVLRVPRGRTTIKFRAVDDTTGRRSRVMIFSVFKKQTSS